MQIKLWKLKKELSPDEIEQLDGKIVRNQSIQALLDSPGWKILDVDLHKILESKSDIRNKSEQSEEYRVGFCDGIEYIFARIRSYKRSAEYAEQRLRKNDG